MIGGGAWIGQLGLGDSRSLNAGVSLGGRWIGGGRAARDGAGPGGSLALALAAGAPPDSALRGAVRRFV